MSDRETIYLAVNLPAQADRAERAAHLDRITKAAAKAAGKKEAHVTLYSDTNAIEQEADRIKRAEYWSDVRGIVDDAKRAILDGELADREQLSDWLHETIDGCGRVIYTAQAMEGLVYSDNDGAYLENFGAEGAVKDGAINWSALMFAALEADVQEMIGDDDQGDSILNADGFCPTCRKAGTITCTGSVDAVCHDHEADEDEDDDEGQEDDAAARREGGD